MHKFFGGKDNVKSLSPFTIQIPSKKDNSRMMGMTAGGEEDQSQRLMHMIEKVKEVQLNNPYSPIITTDQVNLAKCWTDLFAAINRGDKEKAFRLFYDIPQNDSILRLLLLVHSPIYLESVIEYSIDAKKTGINILNSDILFTLGTFEILIKDIAASIACPTKICFSFGLPSHHAFAEQGSGFCILNKTALLIRHAELTHPEPLKYIIVGTDVNRDNGLCEILMQSASHLDICHVDIFDSRVYPQEDQDDIYNQLHLIGKGDSQKIMCWHKNKLDYFAVDLSLTTRQDNSPHPAVTFALQKIKDNIEQAKINRQKTILFLPTGWDSHENETAYCGKFINGRMMRQITAHKCRFNDNDLEYFYEHLFNLYKQNSDFIEGIYWGLEGGYDREMYESQIQLFLSSANKHLIQQGFEQTPQYPQ